MNKPILMMAMRAFLVTCIAFFCLPSEHTARAKSITPFSQMADIEISGVIISKDDGSPLPGASVIVKGAANNGTTTDGEGRFKLTVAENSTLIISFIGYLSQETQVAGKGIINIALVADSRILTEIVVTALGVTREKKSLGYAIQELKGSELVKSNEQNVLNSLSGKVAGVQITAGSGAIGSGSRIVLRGNNSFGNNQPLFVVDGVPVSNFSTNTTSGGGVDYGNAIAEIDPNNIASMSVLKGANAAALYGYQAANGVILITTKNGKGSGKGTSISYSGGFSYEKPYILPKYQNQYGQGVYGEEYMWKKKNDGSTYQDYATSTGFSYLDGLGNGINDGVDESWGPRLDAGLLIPQYNSPLDANGNRTATPWVSNPNNVKDFFQTGYTIDNSVAVSSSSENGDTRLSFGQQKQIGTIPNTDQKRYTIQLNTTQNLTKRLKTNALVNYVRTANDNLVGQGYHANNPMQSLGGWFGRQVDMKDLKEHYNDTFADGMPYNWNNNFHDNPYFNVNNNTHSRYKDRVFGNVSATYRFHEWFSAMARIGTDWSAEQRKEITLNKSNETLTSMADKTWGGGKFTESKYNINEINADLILTGHGNISKDLTLSYTAGANYRNYSYNFSSLGAAQLTVPDLFNIKNAKGSPTTDMTTNKLRTNSVYGQASLGFKDYLYLDVTARNDWSSTLPKGNWSYFYPSASLSWVFTNVIPVNPDILSFGKLRASWASVGNGGSPYQLQSSYNANATAFDGVTLYSISSTLPPLNLKPEKAKSTEVGLELQFLNRRIGLDATYYNKITTNQIMQVNISGASGYSTMQLNAGEIQNKGIELQLNAGIISNSGGFNWDLSVNWAKNKSMVNKLYEDPTTGQKLEAYTITSVWGLTVDAVPGEAYGVMRGSSFARDASTGAIIVGSNGLPTYNSTPTAVGNVMPDWVGGVTNNFTYKNFNFSFLLDMRKGGDVFSVTQWFGLQSGVTAPTVEGGIRENGLIVGQDVLKDEKVTMADGTPNTIRIGARDYFQSLWGGRETAIVDGSFVKLRQIEFGYQLPSAFTLKYPWLKGAGISLFARNIALLYTSKSNVANIDPETGFGVGNDGLGIEQYQIPSNRSIGVKLNLKF
ncbi:SusC/RagA family TonB-linked outer membrane protein [Dyadobacter sp. LJ419]|uniref:SusC/RagA family TonB-linked outer membrane protein n=2 Tax=Dyadobacter chenwenxiniae TaxID=2906456 RepID=A0A9X1PI30_9BACT|nr:SusC/RagA family TonB-linked outer membrane protein [Dyadobacter chenwenxiniae]